MNHMAKLPIVKQSLVHLYAELETNILNWRCGRENPHTNFKIILEDKDLYGNHTKLYFRYNSLVSRPSTSSPTPIPHHSTFSTVTAPSRLGSLHAPPGCIAITTLSPPHQHPSPPRHHPFPSPPTPSCLPSATIWLCLCLHKVARLGRFSAQTGFSALLPMSLISLPATSQIKVRRRIGHP